MIPASAVQYPPLPHDGVAGDVRYLGWESMRMVASFLVLNLLGCAVGAAPRLLAHPASGFPSTPRAVSGSGGRSIPTPHPNV